MFFILDGHHKFIAYGKAKKAPICLIITKKEDEYKSLDYTMKLAKQMNCNKENYFKWMKEEKRNIERYKSYNDLILEKAFKQIKYG